MGAVSVRSPSFAPAAMHADTSGAARYVKAVLSLWIRVVSSGVGELLTSGQCPLVLRKLITTGRVETTLDPEQ
jgi:hypothetical protein